MVEITSVSEEYALSVSRLENEDVGSLRNVGTFLLLYVAFRRRETLVCQSRERQLFELCSRSDQLKLRSVLYVIVPRIVIQLCNVNQQNARLKLML